MSADKRIGFEDKIFQNNSLHVRMNKIETPEQIA